MTLHHSGLYLLNCPFGFISELSFGILSQIFLIIGYGLTIEEHMFFLFSFDFFVSGAGETISTLGFGRDQEGCFATISSVLGCSVSIVSTLIGAITLFFCISFFMLSSVNIRIFCFTNSAWDEAG